MGKLEGKVALVTGAGMGIGRSTAVLLAKEGARVVLADIDEQPAKETSRIIEEAGGQAVFVRTDVSKSEDVEAAVNAAVETARLVKPSSITWSTRTTKRPRISCAWL